MEVQAREEDRFSGGRACSGSRCAQEASHEFWRSAGSGVSESVTQKEERRRGVVCPNVTCWHQVEVNDTNQ
jgi:hypothetical protein